MAGDQSLILMEKLLSKDEALCSWSKVTAGIWGINMQGRVTEGLQVAENMKDRHHNSRVYIQL